MNRRRALLGAVALSACATQAPATPPFPMRRGVNLGNALEAPSEGAWGYVIEPDHLAAIAGAGFDGVRLPVRWDAHAAQIQPYAIAPDFLGRVEQIVTAALARGLFVQLDMHHYQDLIDDPARQRARFIALWTQIAEHFAGASEKLLFEPLNEPHGPNWPVSRVNAFEDLAVNAVRTLSPTRFAVRGGPNWNSIDGLVEWTPSPRLTHCGATVHYYEPRPFTHQNAPWLGAGAPRFDREWGTPDDLHAVAADAERAARWARVHQLPLQVGEFGAIADAPLAQRARWTRTVRQTFENLGAGWCVWDFAGAFRIWDPDQKRFIPEMLAALIDQ